ncbi:MAG: ABC transporter permease [Vicinamibacteria bacterium]
MNELWQDLRHGARRLGKRPGFTLVAVITLALGLGANTAIFSVINALILRAPHIADSQQVAALWSTPKDKHTEGYVSYLDLQDWRSRSRTFASIAGYKPNGFTLLTDGQAERVGGLKVTANFLSLLEVTLVRGRDFVPAEEKGGAEGVVILGYEYWQSRFGGRESALGQSLTLSGRPFTIIGILPKDFEFPLAEDNAQLLTTIASEEGNLEERGAHVLKALGRLGQGATFTAAQAEMKVIADGLAEQFPRQDAGVTTAVVPVDEQIVGPEVRKVLFVLLGAVGFILLIACTNLTNLLLVQASARRKELALRAALGARSGRIARQLLAESLLLSALAGVAGLLLAFLGLSAIRSLGQNQLPRLQEVGIDGRVLLFTLAVSILTTVLVSLIPVFKMSRPDVNEVLKTGAKSMGGGRSLVFWRDSLVVAEVALGLVLLLGAGLMTVSFKRLLNVDPGFDPTNVLAGQISMTRAVYEESDQRIHYVNQTLERLRALPGVESAAFVAPMPFSGGNVGSDFRIEGRPEPEPADAPGASNRSVTPEYFQAMRIPLLKGRFFNDHDQRGGVGAAIINASLARRYFPDEDLLGQRITKIGANQNDGDPEHWEIVGVVGDVHHASLIKAAAPEIYLPYEQNSWTWGNFFVRTGGNPAALTKSFTEEIRSGDRTVLLTRVRPLVDAIADTASATRFYAFLFTAFGVTGLILILTGLYGVVSFAVAQHTQEIGIRMALGARSKDVLKMVIGHGLALTAVGILIGVVAASALTRLMASLLFEVSATDTITFVATSSLLVLMALVACWIPARRATKIEPVAALRYE